MSYILIITAKAKKQYMKHKTQDDLDIYNNNNANIDNNKKTIIIINYNKNN